MQGMVVGVARSKVTAGNKFGIQADAWVSPSYEESPLIPAQPKSKPLFMEQFQEAHMHMAGGVPSGHSLEECWCCQEPQVIWWS